MLGFSGAWGLGFRGSGFRECPCPSWGPHYGLGVAPELRGQCPVVVICTTISINTGSLRVDVGVPVVV